MRRQRPELIQLELKQLELALSEWQGGRERLRPSAPAADEPAPAPATASGTALATPYDFLAGQLIDQDTLARAVSLAAAGQVPVHHVLIAVGWVAETAYVQALAEKLGADVAAGRCLVASNDGAANDDGGPDRISERISGTVGFSDAERTGFAIEAFAHAPDELAGLLRQAQADGKWMLLATRAEIDKLRHGRQGASRLADAIWGFSRIDPLFSAEKPMARWQKLLLPALAAGLVGGQLLPGAALPACLLALTIPFLCVSVIRLAGLAELMRGIVTTSERSPSSISDDVTLPVYSILVPLYDEVDVLPRLMRSLFALDYPAARLDILLVLEETDTATRSAAAAIDLPGNVRVIVVPEGGPRTKPKALNYALGFVVGSYVVVYDAEDRPEPAQLRDALALPKQGRTWCAFRPASTPTIPTLVS